jgi:cytochrome b561
MTDARSARSSDHADGAKPSRRFDVATIGLHWATVALVFGMFANILLRVRPETFYGISMTCSVVG